MNLGNNVNDGGVDSEQNIEEIAKFLRYFRFKMGFNAMGACISLLQRDLTKCQQFISVIRITNFTEQQIYQNGVGVNQHLYHLVSVFDCLGPYYFNSHTTSYYRKIHFSLVDALVLKTTTKNVVMSCL